MSGYDLLFCEMPLLDTWLGPETLFYTRAFDGVLSDAYRITADGYLFCGVNSPMFIETTTTMA